MKKIRRLMLSSYIVVIAGCTHSSAATPEPALGAGERPVHLSRAVATPQDTLSIRIDGPESIRAASTVQVVASVENGRKANARYYYWWFVASCTKRGGCVPSSYRLFDHGENRTSVSLQFGAHNAEKDIVVQVAELDGSGRTGSSVEFPVVGPFRRLGGGAEGFAAAVCDWYAGDFYPHTGKYTDPFSGQSWQRHFRRDYCGNRVSWDPEG